MSLTETPHPGRNPPCPAFASPSPLPPSACPLKQAISTAAQIGAEGIQFDLAREVTATEFGATALKQLVHYVEERNLKVATATYSLTRPLYDFEAIDVRVHALTEAMQLASRLKLRQLTIRVGRIPDEATSAEHVRMVEVLRDLARLGNRIGVVPCVTPSEDASQTLIAVCQSVTDGLLAIDFDPAGTVMTRRDPVATLRELHQHIQHIQFRDGRQDVDGVGVEVPLGRGQVKWDETLALLDEMRFSFWGTVRRTTGDDRVGDCLRAIQYVQRVAMGL